MFPAAYSDNVNKYKQIMYRNKVYRGIMIHYSYSFWERRPQTHELWVSVLRPYFSPIPSPATTF